MRICDICRDSDRAPDKQHEAAFYCTKSSDTAPRFLCDEHRGRGGCCVPLRGMTTTGPVVGMIADVDHPKHYNDHPSGVECIDIVEHMPFNVGNAIKYLWRAGIKATPQLEGLEKARWYVEREIARLKRPPVTITAEVRQRVRDFLYRLGVS